MPKNYAKEVIEMLWKEDTTKSQQGEGKRTQIRKLDLPSLSSNSYSHYPFDFGSRPSLNLTISPAFEKLLG